MQRRHNLKKEQLAIQHFKTYRNLPLELHKIQQVKKVYTSAYLAGKALHQQYSSTAMAKVRYYLGC